MKPFATLTLLIPVLVPALFAALVPGAAVAQVPPAPPVAAQLGPGPSPSPSPSPIDEVLTGTVTGEGAWQNLGIAIPAFPTNADIPTQASAGSTARIGRALAQVITADLKNNGLFKPTGPDGLPMPSLAQVTAPDFPTWQGMNADMLVHGFVRANDDGQLTIGCFLYDVALSQQLAMQDWVVGPADWRRAAHKCADLVYSRLSGESPFFDSKIAYIAETGPKNRRIKRLAIMDSDGANHRFVTTGQAIALTPRYSPDYQQIVYLSYLNGNPRIYIYDTERGTQRLVTQSNNPTFSPRWSPDGKSILYAMAVGGDTDLYRVSAQGGASQRLTDSPGIDVGGSYSPDGSRIVFESDRSGSQQIYVMNADGSDQKRISFFGGRAATPEWSPRGDQIALTYIAGDFHIGVVSPAGSGMRKLTGGWQDEAPTWSPNGRVIQFFRTEKSSGRTGLWQVDLTGRNERRLPTPVDASDPAWGPVLP